MKTKHYIILLAALWALPLSMKANHDCGCQETAEAVKADFLSGELKSPALAKYLRSLIEVPESHLKNTQYA